MTWTSERQSTELTAGMQMTEPGSAVSVAFSLDSAPPQEIRFARGMADYTTPLTHLTIRTIKGVAELIRARARYLQAGVNLIIGWLFGSRLGWLSCNRPVCYAARGRALGNPSISSAVLQNV